MADDADDDLLPAPKDNPILVGHSETEASLKSLVDAGRIGQALLITGPKGIGKATLAYRLARYLLANPTVSEAEMAGSGLFGDALPSAASEAPEAAGLEVSEDNPVFRRIAAEAHADLLTVSRAVDAKTGRLRQDIVVDDVRGVKTFLTKTSGEGGYRVVIVDAADEMNRNAANALLKVLEEPPAKAILILLAHNPGRLLATIRSRCRQITLRPLDIETIVDFLSPRLPNIDADDIRQAANLAGGSMARTIDLVTGDGLDVWRDMSALLSAYPGPDGAKLHAFAGDLARSGHEARFDTFAALLEWWLAERVVAQAKGGVSLGEKGALNDLPPLMPDADGHSPIQSGHGESPVLNLDRWLEVWDKARGLLQRARAINLDRKQVVLSVFFALDQARRG